MKNLLFYTLVVLSFFLLSCRGNTTNTFQQTFFPNYNTGKVANSAEKLVIISIINQQGQNILINAEIADTEAKRAQGLMHRENLPSSQGMLFVFTNTDQHSFWMKNTFIPLDIVFINEDKRIVDILEALPCENDVCPVYKPKTGVRYALELNKGFTEEHGIKIGDEFIFGNI